MGNYDAYGNTQIKVGPCELHEYRIGDYAPIDDGVYLAPEGVIVIVNGMFVAEFKTVQTKWGDELSPADLIDNPIEEAIKWTREDLHRRGEPVVKFDITIRCAK